MENDPSLADERNVCRGLPATPQAAGWKLLDDYVVRRRLGEGGMGEVYLVEHTPSGDLRAAKVMRSRADADAEDIQLFRQEARALLDLGRHYFHVHLHELRIHGRDTVIVMEYVAPTSGCTTIEDWIVRTQDYNDRIIGVWAVQFCVAMEHAQIHGLLAHRDVKPNNLLVNSGVFLKVADYGLALATSHYPGILQETPRALRQLQLLQSADGRSTVGTPGYIAPELCMGGKASAQSDMFSFGVVLWQLATRSLESPWGVRFEGNPMAYHAQTIQRALAASVLPVDSPFAEVIQRCLAPSPVTRYKDFAQMREALKQCIRAAGMVPMDFMVAPGFRGSFEDYVNRGQAYLALGECNRAIRILDQAVRYQPDSPAALLARAEALMERGKTTAALRDYVAAGQLDPQADAPVLGAASAALALNLVAQSRAGVDLVLARHPGNLEAGLLNARLLSEQGDEAGALVQIDQVLAKEPRNARGLEFRAMVLWRSGEIEEAIKHLKRSLDVDPLVLSPRLRLAQLLTEHGARDEAAALYNAARHLFAHSPEVLNEVAAHMAEYGHSHEAIDLFETLAQIAPESRSIMLVNIGNAQNRSGDIEAARQSFLQALGVQPQNALAHRRLGDLDTDANNLGIAAQHYANACRYDPDNAEVHALAGAAFLNIQDIKRAVTHLTRALDLFPGQPRTLYNLAVAKVMTGEEDSATQTLQLAVQLEPTYARAWYLKAHLEIQLDRMQKATAAAHAARTHSASLNEDERNNLESLIAAHRLA
ncbi:MAG: tetratricopeptide repeat protein [Pseudomonadota bacterium]